MEDSADKSLKIEILQGMRAMLREKLSEEESFRHKMLKDKAFSSKKQWNHKSSMLTKTTTAANSISSAVTNQPDS